MRPRRRLAWPAVLPLILLAAGAGCTPPAPPATPTAAATRTTAPASVASPGVAASPSPAASPAVPPAASPTPAATPTAAPSPTPTATATPAGIPSPEASPAVQAPAGWASVTDPNGRWRLDVPLSWRREIRFSHGIFTAPFYDAQVVVRIIPLSEVGGTRDLRAAGTLYVEGMGPPIDRPKVDGVDALPDSAAGTSRVQVRYSYNRRDQPWNATAILDLRGNALHVIDVATTRDTAGQFAETVQHMIGSLRIIY